MLQPDSEETARRRWLVIGAARLAGMAMAIVGLVIVAGGIEQPHWIGYLLLGFGLLDMFLVPQILARKWRSPRE